MSFELSDGLCHLQPNLVPYIKLGEQRLHKRHGQKES